MRHASHRKLKSCFQNYHFKCVSDEINLKMNFSLSNTTDLVQDFRSNQLVYLDLQIYLDIILYQARSKPQNIKA